MGEFPEGINLPDHTLVMELAGFARFMEIKGGPCLQLEIGNVEVPLFHLVLIGQCLPHFFGWCFDGNG